MQKRNLSSRTKDYFQRPLAPVTAPVLAGASLLGALLLVPASKLPNDWAAMFAGVLVFLTVAAVLDYYGRQEAGRRSHPLYSAKRLPHERTLWRPVMVVTTLVILFAVVTWETGRNREPSPYAYLMAAGFLALVMPQLLARRLVRRANSAKRPRP